MDAYVKMLTHVVNSTAHVVKQASGSWNQRPQQLNSLLADGRVI